MNKFYLFLFILALCLQTAFSQDSWQPLDGPGAVKFGNLSYDEKTSSLFDISPQLDLFRSSDLGLTWTRLNLPSARPDSAFDYDYAEIITSPDGALFALCVMKFTKHDYFSYLYKSTDNGLTWSNADNINHHLYRAAIDKDGNLFAVTYDNGYSAQALYMSSDHGDSFKLLASMVDGGIISRSAPTVGLNNELYVETLDTVNFTQKDIYTTTDKGQTWNRLVTPDSVKKPFDFFQCKYGPFYIMYYPSGRSLVISTTDMGANWSKPASVNNYNFKEANRKIYGDMLYSYDTTLTQSTDRGQTWKRINSGQKGIFWNVYQFSQSLVFASTGRGAARSADNGVNWTNVELDYNPNVTTNHIFARDNQVLFSGSGSFYSSDNGDSWNNITYDRTNSAYCYISADGKLFNEQYLSTHNNTRTSFSKDKGKTWRSLFTTSVRDFAENSKGEIFMLLDRNFYRFTATDSLKIVSLPEFYPQEIYLSTAGIAISSNDDIYMLCNLGIITIDHLTDTVQIIVPMENLPLEENLFYLIAFNTKGNIFITDTRTLFISTDNGSSWTKRFQSDTLLDIQDMKIGKNDHIYLLMKNGILVSENDGVNWYAFKEGLPASQPSAFAISESGNAYVGYQHDRLYRRAITTSVSEKIQDIGNASVFPNPAKDRISISLPASFSGRNISVEVYDMSGNRKLETKSFATGNLNLDISSFTSGLYYAVIRSGPDVSAQKFTVIK